MQINLGEVELRLFRAARAWRSGRRCELLFLNNHYFGQGVVKSLLFLLVEPKLLVHWRVPSGTGFPGWLGWFVHLVTILLLVLSKLRQVLLPQLFYRLCLPSRRAALHHLKLLGCVGFPVNLDCLLTNELLNFLRHL